MPLDTVAPIIFSRIARRGLYFMQGWSSITKDISEEITGVSAREIARPDFTTAIAIHDYSVAGNPAADQSLTDDERKLILDKLKIANIVIDDVDLVQRFGGLFVEAAWETGKAMNTQVNNDLRSAFEADISTVAGFTENISTFDMAIGKVGASGTDASLDNAKGRQLLVESLGGMAAKADAKAWPQEGRFMVIHPFIKWMLTIYLVVDAKVIGQGAANDAAYVNNVIANQFGFRPYYDNKIDGDSAPASGTLNDQFAMYFGLEQDSIEFALQLSGAETERVQGKVATRIKNPMVYGAQCFDNDKRLRSRFDVHQASQTPVPVTP